MLMIDPEVVAEDEIIQGKEAYLNVPFFLIRAAICRMYLGSKV